MSPFPSRLGRVDGCRRIARIGIVRPDFHPKASGPAVCSGAATLLDKDLPGAYWKDRELKLPNLSFSSRNRTGTFSAFLRMQVFAMRSFPYL